VSIVAESGAQASTFPSEHTISTEIWARAFTEAAKVPAQTSMDDALATATANEDLSKYEIGKIRWAMEQSITERRAEASKYWSLTGERDVVGELPAYSSDWQNRVTLVRAPMGSGKSAAIGKPFVADSLTRRYTVASTPSTALCQEQAEKYQINNYKDLGGSYATPAISVCLPSLDRKDLSEIISGAGAFLFDEFSQSRAMLASNICNASDFARVGDIFSHMRAGVVFDANLNDSDVDFIKSRVSPDVEVKVIDVKDQVLAPQDRVQASYTYGTTSRSFIVQEALRELLAGGKVVIASASGPATKTIGEILRLEGFKVLIINKANPDPDAERFFQNPEDVSREFDAIVHSPSITSGLSIEHRGNPHFTKGFFFGGGYSVTPSVAAQMIRRVRYLKSWVLGFEPSNSVQAVSATASRRKVAAIENLTRAQLDAYDLFRLSVASDHVNQNADFASALIWRLEDMGWKLSPVPCSVTSELIEQTRAIGEELKAADIAAIVAAPVLSEAEAKEIRFSATQTAQGAYALRAYDIRTTFKVTDLTPDLVEFWDGGRGASRVRHFADAVGIAYQDNRTNLLVNDNAEIRRKLYAYLFDGVDVTGTMTGDIAELIVDRAMARRFSLSAFGVVPATWGRVTELRTKGRAARENDDGSIAEFRRPKYAMREVAAILEMMGLDLKQASRSGKRGAEVRTYAPTEESLALMQSLQSVATCPLITKQLGGIWRPNTPQITDASPTMEVVFSDPMWTEDECPTFDDVPISAYTDAFDEGRFYGEADPEPVDLDGLDIDAMPISGVVPLSLVVRGKRIEQRQPANDASHTASQLRAQGMTCRTLEVGLALANEAEQMMAHINRLPHSIRVRADIVLPLVSASGVPFRVTTEIPALMAGTQTVIDIDGRAMVLPMDINIPEAAFIARAMASRAERRGLLRLPVALAA